MNPSPWLKCLLLAVLSIMFHLLVAVSYFAFANHQPTDGTTGEGTNGIDVGLGQIGSYADMAKQLLAKDALATTPQKKPEPIKPAPVKSVKKEQTKPVKPVVVKKVITKKIIKKKTVAVKQLTTKKLVPTTKKADYIVTKKVAQQKVVKPTPQEIKQQPPKKVSQPTQPTAQETKQVAAKEQVATKASVRGTGIAMEQSTGGFKGSNKDYFSHLLAWLNKYKQYPIAAKKQKQQGVVQLQFTMDPTGNVLAQSIKKTSGHQLLDQSALDMLKLAQPLPQPPEKLKRARLTLVIPINFSLITNN